MVRYSLRRIAQRCSTFLSHTIGKLPQTGTEARGVRFACVMSSFLATIALATSLSAQVGICSNDVTTKRGKPTGMICIGGSNNGQACTGGAGTDWTNDCPGYHVDHPAHCGEYVFFGEMDDNWDNTAQLCQLDVQDWPDSGAPFLTTGGNLSGTTSQDTEATDPELHPFYPAITFDHTRVTQGAGVANLYSAAQTNTIVSGSNLLGTQVLLGTDSYVSIPAGLTDPARWASATKNNVTVGSNYTTPFALMSAVDGSIDFNGTSPTGGTLVGTNGLVNNYSGSPSRITGAQGYTYSGNVVGEMAGVIGYTDNYGEADTIIGVLAYRPSNSGTPSATDRFAILVKPIGYNESPPSGKDFSIYSEIPQPSYLEGNLRVGTDEDTPCDDTEYWNYPCSNLGIKTRSQYVDTRIAADLTANEFQYSVFGEIKVDPASAQNSFARGAALYGYHWTPSNNTNTIGSLEGAYVTAEHNGSGNFSSIFGFDGYAYNASANGSRVNGGNQLAESYGGTVGSVVGQSVGAGALGGTITGDLVSLLIDEPSSTATSVANRYAILINDYSSDDNITNDWAIYSELPQTSYIAGPVDIADILNLDPEVTAPTCSRNGDFYVDTSGAACYCDGTSWFVMAGNGTCT